MVMVERSGALRNLVVLRDELLVLFTGEEGELSSPVARRR